MFRKYSSFIQNIYQGFKELQYVDLLLDLQRIATRKAAFALIYIIIVNILSANEIIYKWPYLYIKTQIHK